MREWKGKAQKKEGVQVSNAESTKVDFWWKQRQTFGSRGAFRINELIIDNLPPPCLDRHVGTHTHTPRVTYGSRSLLCAGQLTQSEVFCLYLLLQSFIFGHKHKLHLMFSAGRKHSLIQCVLGSFMKALSILIFHCLN